MSKTERVAVVTGASSGIGLETARGLARAGYTVHMVGRSPERTRAAVEEVKRSADHAEVHAHLADFSSLEEARRVAEGLLDQLEAVHVLVNNAGLWHQKRCLSRDGFEDTFAVNHLAPFVLTQRLLPLLRASAARVVNVSSRLHEGQRAFAFDDVMREQRYRGLEVYSQSKLANVMFSHELARREAEHGVTSNSLHPGDVATNVTRDSPVLSWLLANVARPFVATPEKGARTSLFLATNPALDGVTGRYYRDQKEKKPSPAALDERARARLWTLSEELAGDKLR